MRERLTYRFLIQLLGAIVLLLVAYVKATETSITIGSMVLKPDGFEAIIAAIGGVLAIVIPFFVTDERATKPIFPKQDSVLSEATRKDNRQRMLDKVEGIWITGYLDHVLNEMAALKLDMKFVEPEKVLQRPGMKDYDLPDSSAILSAFNELGRRLVILGEPGAGKTVTLLQLCRELIAEARKDERKSIPMVLALSSWAAEQPPFEEWLRKEVREKYGLSRKVADDLVVGEQLLYLLDGLDEVAEARRDACLQAIKQFVEVERPIDYVICCRRKEFTALKTRLKVTGEVILQPLDDEQIGEYLSGDEYEGLPPVWSESATLRDFGRIPFILNTIAVVTRGKRERDIRRELGALNDPAPLRDALLEAYVIQRQQERPNTAYPDKRIIRERMKWLAQELIQHDQTDFYIENLQPEWSGTIERQKRFKRRIGISFAATVGLIFLMLNDPTFIWPIRSLIGLGIGWFLGMRISGRIQLVDQLHWRFRGETLYFMLTIGAVFGLVSGATFGLSAGLVSALAMGLVAGITGGFDSRERIEIRTQPNSGITRSLTNFLLVVLISLLAVGIIPGLILWIVFESAQLVGFALAFGIVFGIGFALLRASDNGGISVAQHIILRMFLAHEGHIPYWRYDKFLDYCADLVILRKVGGGYRFVHDYMRQYLASAAFVPDAIPTPPEN